MSRGFDSLLRGNMGGLLGGVLPTGDPTVTQILTRSGVQNRTLARDIKANRYIMRVLSKDS